MLCTVPKPTAKFSSPNGRIRVEIRKDANRKGGAQVHALTHPQDAYGLDFTPDGHLAVGCHDSGVYLWEVTSGQHRKSGKLMVIK